MILIMAAYLQVVLKDERYRTKLNVQSAAIRKLLLDRNDKYTNIIDALKSITEFSGASSAFFVDTDDEKYLYSRPASKDMSLDTDDKKYFYSEVFRYAANVQSSNEKQIGFMRIVPDNHLEKTNQENSKDGENGGQLN